MKTYHDWLVPFLTSYRLSNPEAAWPSSDTLQALYDVYVVSQEVL